MDESKLKSIFELYVDKRTDTITYENCKLILEQLGYTSLLYLFKKNELITFQEFYSCIREQAIKSEQSTDIINLFIQYCTKEGKINREYLELMLKSNLDCPQDYMELLLNQYFKN